MDSQLLLTSLVVKVLVIQRKGEDWKKDNKLVLIVSEVATPKVILNGKKVHLLVLNLILMVVIVVLQARRVPSVKTTVMYLKILMLTVRTHLARSTALKRMVKVKPITWKHLKLFVHNQQHQRNQLPHHQRNQLQLHQRILIHLTDRMLLVLLLMVMLVMVLMVVLLLIILIHLLSLLLLLLLLRRVLLRLKVAVKLEAAAAVHQVKVQQIMRMLRQHNLLRLLPAVQREIMQVVLILQTLEMALLLQRVNLKVTHLVWEIQKLPPPPQQQQQHFLLNSQTTRRVMQTAAGV
ncbi:uncharacterized protein TM35_000561250 [Trypanosoma theileri]|uniref:Uncharacterized protein n=1 Tax=Trypanosoma theileri TaxID=67003 RepID=A0A1X0NGM2_9TRYP|nr:uncharacterized protein TM35_000561250 [Trypanosoma theileri]ORC83827.1 hypothetical protein TM35_000561250 [Trypanosoma theileri]